MKTLLSALVVFLCLVSVCRAADAPLPPPAGTNSFEWWGNLHEISVDLDSKGPTGDFSFIAYFNGEDSTNPSSMILEWRRGMPHPDVLGQPKKDPSLAKSVEAIGKAADNLAALIEPWQRFFWNEKTNNFGASLETWKTYASRQRGQYSFAAETQGGKVLARTSPVALQREDQYYYFLGNSSATEKVTKSSWLASPPTREPFILGTKNLRFFRANIEPAKH